MKVALISFGNTEDLLPVISLAKSLQERGHHPLLIANEDIKPIAAQCNIPTQCVSINVQALFAESISKEHMQASSTSTSFEASHKHVRPYLFQIAETIFHSAQEADLLVIKDHYYMIGQTIAEALNIPIMQLCFQPQSATNEYPYPYYTSFLFRLMSNKQTHLFMDKKLINNSLKVINNFRSNICKLPPTTTKRILSQKYQTPFLQAFSKNAFTPPSDWPDHVHVIGYLQLGRVFAPLPTDLGHFMERPNPKIFIGFGPMSYKTEKIKSLLIKSAETQNVDIVWSYPLSDPDAVNIQNIHPNIVVVNECDHQQLFPYMDCIIHHGGSSTTASALSLGKPQLIYWFKRDEEFWAKRMATLLCGINGGNFKNISYKKFASALDQILKYSKFKENPKKVAERLTQENASIDAITLIESWAGY